MERGKGKLAGSDELDLRRKWGRREMDEGVGGDE